MNLNEEVDCNTANPGAPAAPDPAQCGHQLRCRLHDGHDEEPGAAGTIAEDHWAPHGGALQVNRDGVVGKVGAYWKSAVSVPPGECYADLSPEVLELARKIFADPHRADHLVDIKDNSWVCQHPIKERVEGTMLTCSYSDVAIMEQLWRYYEPGRYRIVRVNDVDTLEPVGDSPEDDETDG